MRHPRCTPLKTLTWQRRQATLEAKATLTERATTWWLGTAPEGFTELARKHVRPIQDRWTVYKFREQGD